MSAVATFPADAVIENPPEDCHDMSLDALEQSRPVTIIESFYVPPSGTGAWQDLWKAIAPFATESRGCRSFQLLGDRRDPRRYSVLTEWDSMRSYNRFRIETRVVWIERFMGCAFHPTLSSTFDVVWDDPRHEAAR